MGKPTTGQKYTLGELVVAPRIKLHKMHKHGKLIEARCTADAFSFISDECNIYSGTFIHGNFHGGTYYGGYFYGGNCDYYGGYFYGGRFSKDVRIYDGWFYGGYYINSEIFEGVFEGTFVDSQRFTDSDDKAVYRMSGACEISEYY